MWEYVWVIPEFLRRSDNVIDIVLDGQWDGFSQALNDALSTRPPRGDESRLPSAYWIDRVLARIRNNDGTPVELSSGNATRVVLEGSEVVASSDHDLFPDERMSVSEFLGLLDRWRAEVVNVQADISAASNDRYNDTYPTCARTFATLRVLSEEMDPVAVSDLLKVQPTRSYWVGDRISRGVRGYRKSNGWFLSSEDAVSSLDVRRHIDWILDAVDETGLLALTAERVVRVDVFCYWESSSGHGGPELSPDQMWRLARLGLPVGFDTYFPRTHKE